MQRNRRRHRKQMAISKASYNGTLIDFIQNIFTVIKLSAEKFTNDRLNEKKKLFLKDLQVVENKTANIHLVFNSFTYLVYIVMILFCIKLLKEINKYE